MTQRLTEAEISALQGRLRDEPGAYPPLPEFPDPRDRDYQHRAFITSRYLRYESTNGYVNVADAYTRVIKFSSIPDSIELWVLDFSVEVQFLNDVGGKNESITINAGNFYEPGIAYESIVARNLVTLSIGRIQVVAKWVYR